MVGFSLIPMLLMKGSSIVEVDTTTTEREGDTPQFEYKATDPFVVDEDFNLLLSFPFCILLMVLLAVVMG
eukprot:CAMPEP_0118660932 /NCGR_PEP_ID=MMETSP0785-20121206/15981_1 /TAXON_ID=91992 /ORGANISM="Bolidomonas pacifica, Strain CCMP 1866" /LENGTH=69 /DNA_ID=CAMNT_0006554281 /DNA_START=81 /DNA_END=290 /DNA_ORIENTATION=-